MFKNYLKVAIRNLWKNKAFSAINIIGLSAGIAVCLLIVLYVVDELSYDKYVPNADRIYRLEADLYFNGTSYYAADSPDPLGPTLVRESPQVEQMVRLYYQNDILVKKDNQNIQDHNAVIADSTFFKVFAIPVIAGNTATALNEPNSIVVSETTAKKYFNSTDVVGKTLYIDNNTYCKITAVIKDMPSNSHFHFNFIRKHGTQGENADGWLSNNTYSYILAKPTATMAAVQKSVDRIINIYVMRALESALHTTEKDVHQNGNHFLYHAMPLTDIHLHSDKSSEFEANGNINYVYIFSVIAVLILLIACVNFMNLSTARSANRAKEVGIRKVAGSTRSNLIFQFLIESVLISFFSLLIALGLAFLLLPLFNQLAGKQMIAGTLFSSWMMPVLIALVLVVGCIAGSYPAFYLSSFQPVQVLKGTIAKGFKSSWLRGSLVVFQFCISIILIIGTIVIYNQLNYIHNKKIGFNRDQVLVIHNAWSLDKQIKPFRQDLLKISGVENATICGALPTAGNFNQNGWFRDASLNPKQAVILTEFDVDENYIPTLGMQMDSGRNFSRDFLSDSTAIILNQAAVKLLGYKNSLNQILYRPDGDNSALSAKPYHVVGIVKDFNFSSMHEKVGPLLITKNEYWAGIAVRINTKNIPSLINQVETKWNSMTSGQPFNYTFMDNDFNNIYKAEQQTGKLFITFAVFAIFIACLGLFGLVTYAAEQRTKEIGIRKVLGANVGGIVTMISKDFLKLVLIAAVIAFPIAWWAMNKWLQSFAFRTNISWWIFLLAGLLTIIIALVTVCFQAIKAAVANPVKSLRTE
ncbi:MAG TPA: ABC transporter permease [Puia sp.]|jgi:putative ABC transport system permease protein|nr:ABC transporter permease [Puia sp.]